jgi:hypothetical protein
MYNRILCIGPPNMFRCYSTILRELIYQCILTVWRIYKNCAILYVVCICLFNNKK